MVEQTPYSKFISYSRYSRFLPDLGRRESYEETVDRYIENVVKKKVTCEKTIDRLRSATLNFEVMPSMRGLMTAGKALDRDNTCLFNCSYLPINDPKCFDEAMFILLCGSGVGFSVERQYVNELPDVPDEIYRSETVIAVHDSKEGWAKALRQFMALLWSGELPKWDVSRVRKAGEPLKTFGGRASGPEPLVELFRFVTNVFLGAKGRKLTSLECHDILCKIGEVVVVGGVRRSAMISLSNLSDDRMRHAKSGQWWELNGQRALANNSAVYTEKPDSETFLREWLSLVESKSGERGIFNRKSAQEITKRNGRRDYNVNFGVNPCSEVVLRPFQFCNLTSVVVRSNDTEETLKNKVEVATILGTIQASFTHFPYLRKIWKRNCDEEALLGVSMTGVFDNPLTCTVGQSEGLLSRLKEHAIEVNKEWAGIIGINPAAAITCVKPEGTVSQLVDSASGLHARYAPYYIRRVRADKKDPMTQFMIDCGIPHEPCVMRPDSTVVFSFKQKAPENAVVTKDLSAIEHLKVWLMFQENWCEHKPSVTISVKEDEWVEVGAFVYKHFDKMSGVSFLPYDGHSYRQAPYEEVDKETWEILPDTPPMNWDDLSKYESGDNTKGSSTLNCTGGMCEIVDLT